MVAFHEVVHFALHWEKFKLGATLMGQFVHSQAYKLSFWEKNRLFIPSCGSTPLPKILIIIDKLKPVSRQLEVVFIIFRW